MLTAEGLRRVRGVRTKFVRLIAGEQTCILETHRVRGVLELVEKRGAAVQMLGGQLRVRWGEHGRLDLWTSQKDCPLAGRQRNHARRTCVWCHKNDLVAAAPTVDVAAPSLAWAHRPPVTLTCANGCPTVSFAPGVFSADEIQRRGWYGGFCPDCNRAQRSA